MAFFGEPFPLLCAAVLDGEPGAAPIRLSQASLMLFLVAVDGFFTTRVSVSVVRVVYEDGDGPAKNALYTTDSMGAKGEEEEPVSIILVWKKKRGGRI